MNDYTIYEKFSFETPTTIREFVSGIDVVQPEDDAFFLHTEETTDRARAWAMADDYAYVRGASSCAHGLWATYCSGSCHDFGFDHTTLWLEKRGYGRPFILTQPYVSGVPSQLGQYATAHGLDLASLSHDGWYGHGSLPIRLTYAGIGACPLEVQATDYLYNKVGADPARPRGQVTR